MSYKKRKNYSKTTYLWALFGHFQAKWWHLGLMWDESEMTISAGSLDDLKKPLNSLGLNNFGLVLNLPYITWPAKDLLI